MSGISDGAPAACYPPRARDAPWWRKAFSGVAGPRLSARAAKLPLVRDQELAFACSLVPGLGHLLVERRAGKAALIFTGYLGLLLWIWFFSGLSPFWSATLPISLHQWVISDCVARARLASGLPRLAGRALTWFSLGTSLLLFVAYRQAGAAAARRLSVLRLTTDRFEPILSEGDRLLILPSAVYDRGDIVYSGSAGGIERVVGLPGDEVSIALGVLRVNGDRLFGERRPMTPPPLPELEGAKLVVPANSFCVFFPVRNEGLRGARLLNFFMIPRDRINGRLSWRYYPEVTRLR